MKNKFTEEAKATMVLLPVVQLNLRETTRKFVSLWSLNTLIYELITVIFYLIKT
jgi:hypothetical protein